MTKKFLLGIALFITALSFADDNTEYLINIESNTHQTMQALNSIDQDLLDFSDLFASQYHYNGNDAFLVNPYGLMYLQNADLPTNGGIREFLSYGLSRYDLLLSSLNNYDGNILNFLLTNGIPSNVASIRSDLSALANIWTNGFVEFYYKPKSFVSNSYTLPGYTWINVNGSSSSKNALSQYDNAWYNSRSINSYIPERLSHLITTLTSTYRLISTNNLPIVTSLGNITNSLNSLLVLTNNFALSEITASNTTKLVEHTSHVDDFLVIYTNDFLRTFLDVHPNGTIPFSLYTSPYVDMMASGQYVPKQDVYNYDTLTDYLYANNKSLTTRLSSLNNYWAYYTEYYRTNDFRYIVQPVTNQFSTYFSSSWLGLPSSFASGYGDYYQSVIDDDGSLAVFRAPYMHFNFTNFWQFLDRYYQSFSNYLRSLNNYSYIDYQTDIQSTNWLHRIFDKIPTNDLSNLVITNNLSITNVLQMTNGVDLSIIEGLLAGSISNDLDLILHACTNHFTLFDQTFHDFGNPFSEYRSWVSSQSNNADTSRYSYLTNAYFSSLNPSASFSHTNWASRIEILLASLVFADSSPTNFVSSTNEVQSQSSQVETSYTQFLNDSTLPDQIQLVERTKGGIVSSVSEWQRIVSVSALPTTFVVVSHGQGNDEIYLGLPGGLSEKDSFYFDIVRGITTFVWCITSLVIMVRFFIWSIRRIVILGRFVFAVFFNH